MIIIEIIIIYYYVLFFFAIIICYLNMLLFAMVLFLCFIIMIDNLKIWIQNFIKFWISKIYLGKKNQRRYENDGNVNLFLLCLMDHLLYYIVWSHIYYDDHSLMSQYFPSFEFFPFFYHHLALWNSPGILSFASEVFRFFNKVFFSPM